MIIESLLGYEVKIEGMATRGYFRTREEAEHILYMLVNELTIKTVSIVGTAVPQPDYEPGYPGGVIAWQYDYPPGPPAKRMVVTQRGEIVGRLEGLPPVTECSTGQIDRDTFDALPVSCF